MEVSETWKVLAENVLIKRCKRWKGKIFEACKTGKTKIVQLLLECYNAEENRLNVKDQIGRTALMHACHNGHKDVVKLLLYHSEEQSIDLNAKDDIGWTAFTYACGNGHTDVVELLLDHSERSVDFNAKSLSGWTAFLQACELGHTDVVKLLLDHSNSNIELNIRTGCEGRTPLMIACGAGHKDVIQLLLEHSHKIDLNASDNTGWTAIMYACGRKHIDVVKLRLDLEKIDFLNIDWNARYTSGGKDVVKLLLKYSEVVGIDKASVGAMPGQEAPILIELRKRKIEADMEGGETSNRYTILSKRGGYNGINAHHIRGCSRHCHWQKDGRGRAETNRRENGGTRPASVHGSRPATNGARPLRSHSRNGTAHEGTAQQTGPRGRQFDARGRFLG